MTSQHPLASANVLVTGGAGFIGSHLVRELVRRGVGRVVVLDSLRYGDPGNLGALSDNVRLVKHTLGFDDRAELERALDGVSYVFHLAAEKHNQSKDDPARVYRANLEGTHTLYEVAAAAGVKKVVFSSSLYAYGRMKGEPFSETEIPKPQTVYGITKLAGEHVLRFFEVQHGMEWNALRYLFVYGPKQFAGMGYKSVIVKNFERLLAGQPPTVYGDGSQTLDYVYVDDVVDATIAAMEQGVSKEVLNVGSGNATSVAMLIDRMIAVSGKQVEKQFEPPDWTAGTTRVGNVDKIARVLGWKARTSLDEGLARTFAWISEHSAGT
ncbi:MAG: NAD-dependent epimerase/dehydratase family protein [Myxococcales bacterium]|nr:NAD-dependent epimerase/dehydratase family protein [Myxococcales bacterium]MCB9579700.1 NAD-dependent epimerase/dehydratase family protein [Polyangiaceae bacterium]